MNDTIRLNLIVEEIFKCSDPDSFVYYSERLIDESTVQNNTLFLAKGHYYKAKGLQLKSKYTDALSFILLCIKEASELNNTFLTSAAYIEMGNIYSELKNQDAAVNYYKTGITKIRNKNQPVALLAAFNNLGGEYIELQRLDSALICFNICDSISNLLNDEINCAYAKGNIGIVLAKQKQFASARKKLLEASQTLEKNNILEPVVNYKTWLSTIEIELSNFSFALHYAEDALRFASKLNIKEKIMLANEQLSNIYTELGKHKEANIALKQYYAYRDSIVNTETITKMANLRTEFEVGQKQAELDAMAENERFKTLIAWILLVALSSVAVLLVIVYRHNRHNKRLLAQLKIQKAELELANETKDRFFSVISHDLRGPMGAIGNLVILANDALVHEEMAELRSLLNMMGDNSREVETLLNNLLHWSVGQRGAYQKHFDTINFNQLVNNVISIYTPIAIAKGIELTFLPSQPSHWVVTDPNSWAVIVRNLVNNAIKFTHTGGKVEINVSQQDNLLVLQVSDTGIGMEASVVDNLFNSSVNLPQWGTNYEKGMGIGLSLIKDFVDINDGKIEVASVLGKGTEFTVMIPVGLANEEHLQFRHQLCFEK